MKNRTRKGERPVIVLLAGSLTGLILSMLAAAAFAFLLTKKDVAYNKLPYLLIAAGAFGALICSFLNTRNLHYRGVISGLISASLFSAAFILICFILSGFSVSVYYLIMAAVNLTLGAIAGIAAKNLR